MNTQWTHKTCLLSKVLPIFINHVECCAQMNQSKLLTRNIVIDKEKYIWFLILLYSECNKCVHLVYSDFGYLCIPAYLCLHDRVHECYAPFPQSLHYTEYSKLHHVYTRERGNQKPFYNTC